MTSLLTPDALDLVTARAFALMQGGEFERALVLCRGAVALSDAIEPLRAEAIACLMLHDGAGARDAIDRALERATARAASDEVVAELHAIAAKAQLEGSNTKGARAHAESALALAGIADAAWLDPFRAGMGTLGRASEAGEVDQQILDATRDLLMAAARGERPLAHAFGLDDAALLAWYDAGLRHLERKAGEDAQRIFRGLVALDASAPLFHFAFAASCELLGENISAQSAFDRAVVVAKATADDIWASALFRRGRFLFAQGELASAATDLARALSLDAPHWNADERDQAQTLVEAARRFADG